ncbi:Protein CBG11416 [Caenorhabditis briggsae]|uniref:Protein CBG11416 n=1 Tax=Caenorhabditis briggsae TaxID=6238 RepID=A8XD28_CAEBR|nr:Protein CBG11416 [Caenorhabditis briggsae]CAP30546.2 Protein CBG11416 [Caenorhabditis briggsae]
MHKSGNNGPAVDTKWYYLGPDKENYGPYMSKDMNFWLQAGYFTPELQLKTENEQNYHTLGEWTQVLGSPPFLTPVHSLEASAATAQWQQVRQQPPMMVMPPGLNNQFPPQMRMQYPPFVQMPFLHQMNQNGPPLMHSQPPSEPIDGSLSHTPDSDDARLAAEQALQQPPSWLVALGLANHGQAQGHGHGPKLHHSHFQAMQQLTKQIQHASIATEPIVKKNVECQTEPTKIEVSKAAASRLLTELMGQTVIIN